eukprot:jgi/Tetstr1/423478/TSEL_014159.t1
MSDEFADDDAACLAALEDFERSHGNSQPSNPGSQAPNMPSKPAPARPKGFGGMRGMIPPPGMPAPEFDPEDEPYEEPPDDYDEGPPHPDDFQPPAAAQRAPPHAAPGGPGPQSSGSVKRKEPELEEPQGEPTMECPCGAGPCRVWTANTAANPGRQFFKCPKPKGEQCRHFKWVDEYVAEGDGPDAARQRTGDQRPAPWDTAVRVDAPPATGAAQCFKCGGSGHWARDCPGPAASGSAGAWVSPPRRAAAAAAGPFGSAAQPAGGGACYKCGQPGHWARNCPAPRGGALGGGSEFGGGGGGGGSCFVCGGIGHWARDCPAA